MVTNFLRGVAGAGGQLSRKIPLASRLRGRRGDRRLALAEQALRWAVQPSKFTREFRSEALRSRQFPSRNRSFWGTSWGTKGPFSDLIRRFVKYVTQCRYTIDAQ